MERSLLAELIAAFPPRPLTPALLADAHGLWECYPRAEMFAADLNGRSWHQLGTDFTEPYFLAPSFMTPEAFAAFLPAYLATLLRGDTENELPEFTFYRLTRKTGWEDEFDARAARFNDAQRLAIVHVLESLARGTRFPHFRDLIEAALASWRPLLPPMSP